MPADFSADVKRLVALLARKPLRAEEIIERLERFDAAVLIADDDARYVGANTRATTLTGYSTLELITMSVPDLTGDVKRASRVVVEAVLPGTGASVLLTTDAFEARALQHEIDHCAGLLFLDRVAGAHAVYQRKVYL